MSEDAGEGASPKPVAGADVPPYRYTATMAAGIEARWQDRWEAKHTFEAPNPAGPMAEPERVAGRDKLYVLDMFPYPSGAGLHVGHPLGYIATDVFARFQRMCGRNVLHALGYDAFGLPAEQYAVQTGQHPRATTEANIATMRRQLRRLGLAHDARRSVATTDPAFYRWTQWIFTRIFDAWYDEEAGRARTIGELEAAYTSGERATQDGRAWGELNEDERRDLIDRQRLAYLSEEPVNWCPGLGTVLANEEVTADGRSERGNFPVFRRNLRQWMMRITAYADRLTADLDRLDWPESTKTMQRNWIGRSEGALIDFAVAGAGGAGTSGDPVTVFTTRPDTLYGATYLVLAPEHPLVDAIVPGRWPAADAPDSWTGGAATPAEAAASYRASIVGRSDVERQAEGRAKTGVFTGAYATNPATGDPIPVFVADYVLTGYGTGAIMAVPGEDERDWEFAEAFGLPIVRTVRPPEGFDGGAYAGDGPAINSGFLDVLRIAEARPAIVDWLAERGAGRATVTYRLRDWLFSRQRYWGEPFPIVYDDAGRPVALPDELLPVTLPEVDDYSPKTFADDDETSEPEPPLARAADWAEVTLDLGDGPRRYRRDTNTMPNWAGSCWYELRYLDPTNEQTFCDPAVERYWMGPRPGAVADGVGAAAGPPGAATGAPDPGGVDLYVGGVEHAVLHLLYARFWHKVLYDLGWVSSEEPFRRLYNQGYIQAPAYTDARGFYVPAGEVAEAEGGGFAWNGEPVRQEFGKMGKSLKNTVTPDEMYDEYGADTLRLYEMSMGPLDTSRPWETRAVVGSQRFLQRLWRLVVDEATGATRVDDAPADDTTRRALHRTIDGVRAEMTALRFNTAIAKLTELVNALTRGAGAAGAPREAAEPLVLMVAPFAPHVAEELWSRLGHAASLAYEPFPAADPALLAAETVTCVVQVGGKVRDRIEVPASLDEAELERRALDCPGARRALDGRAVRRVVVRPPGLVNFVPG